MADALGRYLSFQSVAADYDRTRVIPGPMLEEIALVLEREAHLERGGLFLDAGVGTGRFAVPLAKRHPRQIVGIDVAPAMLAQAGAKTTPGQPGAGSGRPAAAAVPLGRVLPGRFWSTSST